MLYTALFSQEVVDRIASYLVSWRNLIKLDLVLFHEGNGAVRSRFLAAAKKNLYHQMQHNKQMANVIRYRGLDPDHNSTFKNICIEVCRKHREQPKQMKEKDWFILDFCMTEKFIRSQLPKSRGQIVQRMGW